MTEENKQLMLAWKRKKHFDGETCGVKGCTKPAEGYVCDVKPTKGGKAGRLWFGPACTKCVQASHPSMKPMTLAELAYQRNGVSDLAMVLDIEVGEMKKRLEEAGIDAKGNTTVNIQGDEITMTEEQVAASGGGPVVVPPVPQQVAEIPEQSQLVPQAPPGALLVRVETESIAVPVDDLARTEHETNEALVYLTTFQILDQQTMDNAGAWLQKVKARWNELDELRKEIVRPWREKVTEAQNYFRSPQAALQEAERILKEKINEGRASLAAAQEQAMQQAQQALQAGNHQAVAQASQIVAQSDVTLPQGVSQRKVWRWRIVNPALVPSNFWGIMNNLIQQAVDGGARQIPGVEIWEEPQLAARAAT